MFKRILTGVLALLLTVGMMVAPVSAATFTAGDINNDGQVNLLDVMIGLRLLSGKSYKGSYKAQAIFVNGDGLGNLQDLVMILRKTAGWSVSFIPAASSAEAFQLDDFSFSIINSKIKMMSQNLKHSSDLQGRDTCLQKLVSKYTPDVISFQEYRSAWTTAVPGASATKAFYVDNNGNKTATANNYNYVINTTSSSVMGSGYQGYVQTRADLNQMYSSVSAAQTAYKQYLAAGSSADPLDYAPQIDERLAIYWKTSVLELVDQGRFLINDHVYDDTLPEYRPTPGKANPITMKDNSTPDDTSDDYFYNNDNRLVVWVKLKIKATGEMVYVFNAHGPNVSDTTAAVEAEMIPSMEIIMEGMVNEIEENGDNPDKMSVFLTGDLNVDYYGYKSPYGFYDRPAWELITEQYGYTDISVAEEGVRPQGTFKGSNIPGNHQGTEDDWYISAKPDYFFARGNVFSTCLNYKVLLETFDANNNFAAEYNPFDATLESRKFISDHFGIYGEFIIT